MTTALPPGSVGQPKRRVLGFSPDSTVDVRQVSDEDWVTLHELLYHAKLDDFNVPLKTLTDFASVPREFVWFIPRYGRYTKAAILHDYLCRVLVPAEHIDRIDADGVFLQAMRELGVPFLRRWIMWAAVRWGALTKQADRKHWWREAWRVALLTAAALPIVAPAAAIIFITRYLIYAVEWLFYLPLSANSAIRAKRHLAIKKVNKPALRSRL
jgi:uncharacterized protein DUF1353